MKYLILLTMVLTLSLFAFSQSQMFINMIDGTADSVLLSQVKSITFKSSTVPGTVILSDSFDTGISSWIGYGDPLPVWVASGFGRTGLFDNNGDPMYNSGGYSTATVSTTNGMIIESDIYLNITDVTGCWTGAEIGLTKVANPTPISTGIEQGLQYSMDFSGDACWGDSVQYQRHKWLAMEVWAEDGTIDTPPWGRAPSLLADKYSSTAWHTLKVDIAPDRIVRFYCDGDLIWTSVKKINPQLLSGKNVSLGWRSSGSAGKAYHDWVRVTTY